MIRMLVVEKDTMPRVHEAGANPTSTTSRVGSPYCWF